MSVFKPEMCVAVPIRVNVLRIAQLYVSIETVDCEPFSQQFCRTREAERTSMLKA